MSANKEHPTVLVAGSTQATADPADELAGHDEFSVETVGSVIDLPSTDVSSAECIVLVSDRTDSEWVDVVRTIRSTDPTLPVVLATGDGNERLAATAVKYDITRYVTLTDDTTPPLDETVESAVGADGFETSRNTGQSGSELEQYKQMIQTLPDIVFQIDSEGTIITSNERAAELLGYDRSAVHGKQLSEFVEDGVFPAEIKQKYRETVRELFGTDDKDIGRYEVTAPCADGEQRIFECLISLRPFDDEFRGCVGVMRDTTEQRQHEKKLEQQNERLEEFASVVSHDLRNPLNVAISRTEMIRNCESEHVTKVESALKRMEHLIDNLLSAAQRGVSAQTDELVSIDEIANQAWNVVETGDATLVVDTELGIRADSNRLQQLFENLFRNAIDHTDEPPTVRVGPLEPIRTSTRAIRETPPNGFYVSDNGPGIKQEDRERIFEYGEASSEGGTGLGLAIVQDIATEHDWQIHVTDSSSGGARFEIDGVTVCRA